MLGISFALDVDVVAEVHPVDLFEAFVEIDAILRSHGFHSVQGNLYLTLEGDDDENMAILATAMEGLRNLPWFPESARQVYAFRVESWSNFSDFVKST
jgi:virulence-associated protein VapD